MGEKCSKMLSLYIPCLLKKVAKALFTKKWHFQNRLKNHYLNIWATYVGKFIAKIFQK